MMEAAGLSEDGSGKRGNEKRKKSRANERFGWRQRGTEGETQGTCVMPFEGDGEASPGKRKNGIDKGAWGMPGLSEAKKDVTSCEKPGRGANTR